MSISINCTLHDWIRTERPSSTSVARPGRDCGDSEPLLGIYVVIIDGWVNFYGVIGHDEASSGSSPWLKRHDQSLHQTQRAGYTLDSAEPRNVALTVPADMAAGNTTMTPPGRRTQNPSHDARTGCAWYRCGAKLSIIET